jgi:uncharacterized protein (UPF0335 family)
MTGTGPNERARLQSIVDRIERLNEERAALASDIKDIYAEAKSAGYDVPALRVLIRERAMDADKLATREAMLDLYRHALGQLADTPLGQVMAP